MLQHMNLEIISLTEKKPDAKENTLFDSIYMKHPEKANLQRRKSDPCCLGFGVGAGMDCKLT